MSSSIAIPRAIYPGRLLAPAKVKGAAKVSVLILAVCAVHTPLALFCHQFPLLAELHAWTTLAVGIALALAGRRSLIRVAYWSAYMSGVEVMWRMANAQVYWEFGKYATCLVLLLALLRSHRLKFHVLPICYFALLVPSIVLTVVGTDLATARGNISGNLSGPLALMVCALFFSNLKLNIDDVKKILLAAIIPTLGIAVITIYSTAAAERLVFTANSNKITSGGFGPNQVSATLGLGVLAAWLCLSLTRSKTWLKVFIFAAMVILAIQSALTFSRGGLYNAGLGMLLGSIVLMKDRNSRVKVLLGLAALFMVANFVVLPLLENFTGGTLGTRFANVDPSGRTEIVLADLEIWRDNPFLGLGPGMAKGNRSAYYERAGHNGAHTEFTRLLAEHGILGLGALIIFLVAGVKNFKKASTPKGKAIVASMIGWSFLYMTNAAMRLVAPAFAFGMTFATFLPEENPVNKGANGNAVRRDTFLSRSRRRDRILRPEYLSRTATGIKGNPSAS